MHSDAVRKDQEKALRSCSTARGWHGPDLDVHGPLVEIASLAYEGSRVMPNMGTRHLWRRVDLRKKSHLTLRGGLLAAASHRIISACVVTLRVTSTDPNEVFFFGGYGASFVLVFFFKLHKSMELSWSTFVIHSNCRRLLVKSYNMFLCVCLFAPYARFIIRIVGSVLQLLIVSVDL